MTGLRYAQVWTSIVNHLDRGLPSWRDNVATWGQATAVADRRSGKRWSDDEVFRGLVLSVLSNNTNWARVERVKSELDGLFSEFSIVRFASRSVEDVDRILIPWFTDRRASSMTLRARLRDLIIASEKLVVQSKHFGSIEKYFSKILESRSQDPKRLAAALAEPRSPDKLNGIGLPLAAEFLKNIGFDVAKPDRHVNRAVGAFGWVSFKIWDDRQLRHPPPQPTFDELLSVMNAIESCARAVGETAALVDNAVWLLCAKSGLSLSNSQLECEIGAGG